MAFVKKLFDRNFLEYASYVIKDRAIPDIEDGLKPVQRRILHSLFEMDDGKYHKVANVVGHCMKYHPHGDASIADALVVLANKDLFIDRQGNFGNIFTGDAASASRYIECRATKLAKAVFYNPKLTEMADSYDGRNRETLKFPAKLPVILAIGGEGIAVGMSTKILPHNILEIIEAEKSILSGKSFELFPDFPTGGLVDVSEYADGNGKVLVRARLDTSDPKRIVIRELPYGSTTESLIASIEAATKAGRLKIQSISDYTSEQVEIEIRLGRGVYTEETIDALYAFTECEQSISVNLLVIKDGLPQIMTVSEVLHYHSAQLKAILKKELELERSELLDKLHQRTLERIFIEERIYKKIEDKKTAEAVKKAIVDGFKPWMEEIGPRGVSSEDIERLLKIPIRRISLYDIEKARLEMQEIQARIEEIAQHLKALVAYTIAWLDGIAAEIKNNEEMLNGRRRTKVGRFEKTDVKEAVKRDLSLRYDAATGYLGTSVAGGKELLTVSTFDRILYIRKNGIFQVIAVPDKLFVDKGLLWCGLADKDELADTVFSLVLRDKKERQPWVKRFQIDAWIMNRDYTLVGEAFDILHLDIRKTFFLVCHYKPKPRQKILIEQFAIEDYLIKGWKAGPVRLAPRELSKIEVRAKEVSLE